MSRGFRDTFSMGFPGGKHNPSGPFPGTPFPAGSGKPFSFGPIPRDDPPPGPSKTLREHIVDRLEEQKKWLAKLHKANKALIEIAEKSTTSGKRSAADEVISGEKADMIASVGWPGILHLPGVLGSANADPWSNFGSPGTAWNQKSFGNNPPGMPLGQGRNDLKRPAWASRETVDYTRRRRNLEHLLPTQRYDVLEQEIMAFAGMALKDEDNGTLFGDPAPTAMLDSKSRKKCLSKVLQLAGDDDSDTSGGYAATAAHDADELPIFDVQRVQLRFDISADFVAAQVANNVLILALSTGRILRFDLDNAEDIDDIDLPKRPAEIGVIRRLFMDPSASHLIISTTLGENYYLHTQS
ncbi:hypothetical protein KC316_g5473, partial [Hortaea werneckii]